MKANLNFLLVGAPKSGTTSVSKYLGEHPEIFIPEKKELFYFIGDIVKKISTEDPMYDAILKRSVLEKSEFDKLFESRKEKMRGEATVHYLYHYKEVIPKVKMEYGDIKIIILLRDPTRRAFSNYCFQKAFSDHNFKIKGEVSTFESALKLEDERKNCNYNSFWFYKSVGNYFEAVKAFLENFSEVEIVFYKDLSENPIKFMKRLYSFLGVKSSYVPNTQKRHNPTIVPKNKVIFFLYFFKRKLHLRTVLPSWLKLMIFKKLDVSLKKQTELDLKNYYQPDIKKLEDLIKKDLSSWYK